MSSFKANQPHPTRRVCSGSEGQTVEAILRGFETASFPSEFSGLDGVLRLQKDVERIQRRLEQFLPAQEARETAMQVYGVALDIDEDIRRIRKDPLAGRLYEYDGQFFTRRGTSQFHVAFDGIHILRWLSSSTIDRFFQGRENPAALKWMMDELGKYIWLAKRRRMNWEESHTVSLFPDGVLKAIIEDYREHQKQAGKDSRPLSSEEEEFFKSFEDELARPDSRP